jgi:hypothetical protein
MQIPNLAVPCVLAALALAFGFGPRRDFSRQLGQEPTPIPLASEPHHHLALENEYVKLYQVEVAPHDSVKLHRHDTDAISLSLSDSVVTVHFPGKADVTQKLAFGQLRLQARGWVHSTLVEEGPPFKNVTVELLQAQTGERNGCAQVMAKEPLNCFGGTIGGVRLGQPEFQTDQTYVGLVRVSAHGRSEIGDGRVALIVALDGGATHRGGDGAESSLRSGDFVWLDAGHAGEAFQNDSAKEVRLILFAFQPTAGR